MQEPTHSIQWDGHKVTDHTDDIAENVINRFKAVQKKKVTGEYRAPTVHVSHLVGECMRKPWYDFHEEKPPLDYSSICNFFAGTILHENAPLSKRNEVPLGANIRTMKPIKSEDVNDTNLFDCVTGTVDDIIEFEGDIIITDKKTCKAVKKEPDESYITQINIYKLLLWINEGIEADYGSIIYLNKVTSFKDPQCFVFKLKSIEAIEKDIIQKLDQLKCKDPPERVTSWKCNWCEFAKICDPPINLRSKSW